MKAHFQKYTLDFINPSGTSRGVLTQKDSYFIILENDGRRYIGECGLLKGLSYDDVPDYEDKLAWVCENIHLGKDVLWESLREFPSIQFGVEQVYMALENQQIVYTDLDTSFSKGKEGIPINGLIWMGEPAFMKKQIDEKIKQGFDCIKMKIGAIDFEKEYELLQYIRKEFPKDKLELRVDANGGFSFEEVSDVLSKLADLDIHSIEQPIKAKQVLKMKQLCAKALLPIALDEELIGITNFDIKRELLEVIKPQYIILKPSLIGGIKGSEEWISIAEDLGIGWWITSALESNIGLHTIAQFTNRLQNPMPQGLGTGSLYTNNIDSPLEVANGKLWHTEKAWDFSKIK